jgi:hypothetical protein
LIFSSSTIVFSKTTPECEEETFVKREEVVWEEFLHAASNSIVTRQADNNLPIT